ncbi:MAG: hypothetical protein LC725_01185 [Lentisphaerae bacterium]|nr:hypothetical protein [Lentisphaerota bacterium]
MHKLTVPILMAGALAAWMGLHSRDALPPAPSIAADSPLAQHSLPPGPAARAPIDHVAIIVPEQAPVAPVEAPVAGEEDIAQLVEWRMRPGRRKSRWELQTAGGRGMPPVSCCMSSRSSRWPSPPNLCRAP